MAKKNKDEAPNANSIVNRDIMQRLNFMYQASVYLSGVLPAPPADAAPVPQKRKKKARRMTIHDLSKSYVSSMKVVTNKTMVKMDPAVKRTLCNGCNLVLIPGSTASVRVKTSTAHGHLMIYRCSSCNSTRRIPAPPTLVASSSMASTLQSTPATSTSTSMDVDPTASTSRRKKKKRVPTPRLPPLFARDVGHVVLVGADKLPPPDTLAGDGIYIT
ncbi:RNAse P Rpr2/Rpp21/SNM1 subunit domain-containing protein [Mycena rebaudengoi]|nr:RNAse P Rpr2/Rpp21/SNM1 subunit domain-containing protein [Mycena rebaudengoi]